MRSLVFLVGTGLLLTLSWCDRASADNTCSYPQASGSSPYDLSEIIANSHLLGDMQIFNIYWSDNWDATQPFTEDRIDNATKALVESGYFDKACQYDVPKMHFGGSRSTKGFTPCSSNPLPSENLIGLMQFLACEEASNQVATAKGVASPACLGCDLSTGFRCYTDGACLSQPNPSGDTIYNIFLPTGVTVPDQGLCDTAQAFHFQVPSDQYLYITPGTDGIPLYMAVIPLGCNTSSPGVPDFNALMDSVSHEDIEAATNPIAGACWSNTSCCSDKGPETADVCQHLGIDNLNYTPPTSANSRPFQVAPYWSNRDHACVGPSSSPPTVQASLLPTPTPAGWNNTDVSVTITARDKQIVSPTLILGAGVKDIAYSATGALTLSSTTVQFGGEEPAQTGFVDNKEGQTQAVFSTDTFGGRSASGSVTIRIDKTLPTMQFNGQLPTANSFGWYGTNPPNNAPVTVAFQCQDVPSGIQSCAAVTLSTEGANQYAVGRAIDNAGNVQTLSIGPISIDLTMPVISFSGNAGTYDASATINITCSATDALSGVYTQNCPNIQGPAYAFGVQTSTFAGTATDKAGNVGSGTVTFTVVVTPAGLKALVDRFVSSAAIANSLDRKLDRVAAAIASGDEQLKAGVVGAFIDEVNAIRGIKISEGDADILVYLAGFL